MHATLIIVTSFAMVITAVMARPWSDLIHDGMDGAARHDRFSWGIKKHHGQQWSNAQIARELRFPRLVATKVGKLWPTFIAENIRHDKYLLITPSVMFSIQNQENKSNAGSNFLAQRTTTEKPKIEENERKKRSTMKINFL